MKLGQILDFESFYNSICDKPLQIKTAYKLSRLSKAIADNIDFYKVKLSELLDKYGVRDDNGNLIPTASGFKIKEDKLDECMIKLSELSNLDIDLPDIKFKLEEFNDINISLSDMNVLMLFIEE